MTTRFDKRLELLSASSCSDELIDSLIYVNDTLQTCVSIARDLFGENVKAEIALEIYDRVRKQQIHLVVAKRCEQERGKDD